jgi:hypothetical protein
MKCFAFLSLFLAPEDFAHSPSRATDAGFIGEKTRQVRQGKPGRVTQKTGGLD